jgi:hypothetical protein
MSRSPSEHPRTELLAVIDEVLARPTTPDFIRSLLEPRRERLLASDAAVVEDDIGLLAPATASAWVTRGSRPPRSEPGQPVRKRLPPPK